MPRCELCSTRPKCPLSKVSAVALELLRPQIVETSVGVGTSIELQNETPSHLSVIKIGYFKGDRRGQGGERSAVCVVGRGRIGGYSGLFKQPSVMTLTALVPSRVCQIPINAIYDHAFVERDFRQYLYGAVGRHIENLADWSALIRESNISKRLMMAFELLAREEGSRTIRIPSHMVLGELVVARRESVARHIAQLLRAGKIRKLDRWRILLNPGAEDTAVPGDAPGQPAPSAEA